MPTSAGKYVTTPDKSVKLDPEVESILKELGRAQTKYNEYGASGRADLQQGAHQYADTLRADATAKGIDLSGFGVKNQYGTDYTQYYTPDQPQKASTPAPAPAQPTSTSPAPQTTNPLPSSTSAGQAAMGAATPSKVDMNAVQGRAQNDANLQIEPLRQQAQQGYNRFASEGQSQIDLLRAMYAPQYEQNRLNTVSSAKSAVQNAANRGFFASGLSADAEMRANLDGERQRMALQGQENAQVGQIYNRVNLAGQELNDTLFNLTGREGQLAQSLRSSYLNDERNFDLQNRGLSSDIALRLLGMDQSSDQFNRGLNWDMNKFGQQLGENATQRAWQSGENQAQRDWTGTQNQQNRVWQGEQSALDRQNRIDLANLDANTRMQLQTAQQAWQSGQASLDRADSQYRWQIETGLKAKWQMEQQKFDQDQFQWRKDESAADRTLRVQAANSQWMAFADQAIQAGQWKSLDDAAKALDSYTGRIVSDGADMSSLYDYIKRRMGGSTSSSPIPAGAQGNTNSTYPYFPNTYIGPSR